MLGRGARRRRQMRVIFHRAAKGLGTGNVTPYPDVSSGWVDRRKMPGADPHCAHSTSAKYWAIKPNSASASMDIGLFGFRWLYCQLLHQPKWGLRSHFASGTT